MSTRIALWLLGLCRIVHIIAWLIWTPGVAQALSMGELPCRLPHWNVAGGGKVGCRERILSTNPPEITNVEISCCRISPLKSASNMTLSPICVKALIAWARSWRKAACGQIKWSIESKNQCCWAYTLRSREREFWQGWYPKITCKCCPEWLNKVQTDQWPKPDRSFAEPVMYWVAKPVPIQKVLPNYREAPLKVQELQICFKIDPVLRDRLLEFFVPSHIFCFRNCFWCKPSKDRISVFML